MAETITISKKEYRELKQSQKIDQELLTQLISSFEDIKAGRIKRVH